MNFRLYYSFEASIRIPSRAQGGLDHREWAGALDLLVVIAPEHSTYAAGGGFRYPFRRDGTAIADQNTKTDLWIRSNLPDDLGGLRPWMHYYGLQLGATETSEILHNPTGGTRQGAIYARGGAR
jgi:hypothetical protein